MWMEGVSKAREPEFEKTSRLIIFIEHHNNIFTKSTELYDLIPEITE